MGLIVCMGALVVMIHSGTHPWVFIQYIIYNKVIITCISLYIYSVCVGGLIYCTIHKQPWVGVDMSRGVQHVIAPSDKYQYILEGCIVGGLYISIAGITLFLVGYPIDSTVIANPTPTSRSSLNCPTNPTKNTSKLGWLSPILGILLVILIVILTLTLYRVYSIKNPWYRVTDTLPPLLKIYFTSPVLKSSDIFKRCARLVEILVFEYPVYNLHTLKVFIETKLRPLLLDYLFHLV